nr:MAG TPA: hypothetical protein [Bacteriophage sp.]
MYSVYSKLVNNASIEQLANDLVNSGKTIDFDTDRGLSVLNIATANGQGQDFTTVISKVSQALLSEVNLYKNDFKGQLVSFIDTAKLLLSSGEPSTASKFNIVELDLPDLLKEAKDLNLFQDPINYNEIRNIDYELPMVELDIVTHPDAAVNRHIKTLFTANDLKNPVDYINMANTILDKEECIFYAETILKSWLIATYLKNERLATLSINAKQLDNIIWKLETYLFHAIEAYEQYVSINKLYLGTLKNDPYSVYVLKPVFDSCDNEIGLVDAIYGYSIKDKNTKAPGDTTKDIFLANKQELIKIWDTYVIGTQVENPIYRRNRLIDIYTRSLEEVLRNMPEELLSYCSYGDNIPVLADKVRDRLVSIRLDDDLECIETIGIELVAGILFDTTNYYKFIKLCEKYLAEDSEKTVDDIISFVLTELVVDFFMSKTKIFKIQ